MAEAEAEAEDVRLGGCIVIIWISLVRSRVTFFATGKGVRKAGIGI